MIMLIMLMRHEVHEVDTVNIDNNSTKEVCIVCSCVLREYRDFVFS